MYIVLGDFREPQAYDSASYWGGSCCVKGSMCKLTTISSALTPGVYCHQPDRACLWPLGQRLVSVPCHTAVRITGQERLAAEWACRISTSSIAMVSLWGFAYASYYVGSSE